MTRTFLIVQNGLKDLRGHYFETAVSVAEAARAAGLSPVLAAHEHCPRDLVPAWLPFHPVCRTDHWLNPVPPSPPPAHVRLRRLRVAVKRALGPVAPAVRAVWRARHVVRPTPTVPPPPRTVAEKLAAAGFGAEAGHVRTAAEDLARLWDVVKLRPGDHVFHPTAHGRDAVAVAGLLRGHPAAPTWHLEFHHALDMADATFGPDWYASLHRVLFDEFRPHAASLPVRLYADTPMLAAEYAGFAGLPVGTLPIPFQTELLPPRVRRPGDPLCLAYLGDVRDEKGFYWLADLAADLADDLAAGRVTFRLQASAVPEAFSARSREALGKLKRIPTGVTLVGEGGPLSRGEYFDILAHADVVVCPYCPQAYARRSSGTFTEAVAAGLPTVVRAGTWLEQEQPPGGGETFTDRAGLFGAVSRIRTNHDRYRAAAEAYRARWLATHTPAKLVECLLGGGEAKAA